MSYTEIYGFDKEGNAYSQADIKNAWRGAMAIWNILEDRHLPPYIPDYVKYCNWYRPDMPYDEMVERNGFKPTRNAPSFGSDNPMQEVWDIAKNPEIPEIDRVVMMTTFDMVLVKKADLPKVIKFFNEFQGETSLKEQAKVLEEMIGDENCIAVGWNQTSVNGDTWTNFNYDEESEEYTPYNCLTQDEHWWLFDSLVGNE